MSFHAIVLIMVGLAGRRCRQGYFAIYYGSFSIIHSFILLAWKPAILMWFVSQVIFESVIFMMAYNYLRDGIVRSILLSASVFCITLNLGEAIHYDSFSTTYEYYSDINFIIFEIIIAALAFRPLYKRRLRMYKGLLKRRIIKNILITIVIGSSMVGCSLVPEIPIPNPLEAEKGINVSAQVGKTNTQVTSKSLAHVELSTKHTDKSSNVAGTINQYKEEVPVWILLALLCGWSLLIPSPITYLTHRRRIKELKGLNEELRRVYNVSSQTA